VSNYRPPDQGEPADEPFLLQLQEASRSQSLVLLADFNHPDTCWKSNVVSSRQPRRFLECTEDHFLSEIIDTPAQGDAIPDLMLTSASELLGDVKTGGSLGCSDHALVRDMGKARTVVRTLNFRRADFQAVSQ